VQPVMVVEVSFCIYLVSGCFGCFLGFFNGWCGLFFLITT